MPSPSSIIALAKINAARDAEERVEYQRKTRDRELLEEIATRLRRIDRRLTAQDAPQPSKD